MESVRQHGKENLVVLLGAPNAESSAIAAETVVAGDPSYAGPLAGVQLDLPEFQESRQDQLVLWGLGLRFPWDRVVLGEQGLHNNVRNDTVMMMTMIMNQTCY